jgi:hypothetical protein
MIKKKTLQYLWCCISPNSHVITEEEENRSFSEMVTCCDRCRCPVRVWIDKYCKEDEYWVQEID